MADTFDVVVQVYDDVSGELKGDANVKTSAGMTYFSDGESLQEKVDSGEFTSGEQGPEGPPGPNSADLISVVDTEGLLGTPGTVVMSQNLFDAIVDRVANKLLPYARLANNGLTTEEGFALDARYGKTLKELFDSVNINLNAKADASALNGKLSNITPSMLTNIGYNTAKGAVGIDINGTEYIVPISILGDNYMVKRLGIVDSTVSGKKALQVNWWADGVDYTNTISFD